MIYILFILVVILFVWVYKNELAKNKNTDLLTDLLRQTDRRLNNLEDKVTKLELIVWEDITKDEVHKKKGQEMIQEYREEHFEKFNFKRD